MFVCTPHGMKIWERPLHAGTSGHGGGGRSQRFSRGLTSAIKLVAIYTQGEP